MLSCCVLAGTVFHSARQGGVSSELYKYQVAVVGPLSNLLDCYYYYDVRGVDLDLEKPVIPPALGVQVDRREGGRRKKKSSRVSSTFNEQKGHRQNQNAAPSIIRSPPAPIVFWLWLRLGGKRSSLKGWAGDDQGPIQLPGAPCSQHRPPYPANGCAASPIQEGKPCELAIISVRAAGQSPSLTLHPE